MTTVHDSAGKSNSPAVVIQDELRLDFQRRLIEGNSRKRVARTSKTQRPGPAPEAQGQGPGIHDDPTHITPYLQTMLPHVTAYRRLVVAARRHIRNVANGQDEEHSLQDLRRRVRMALQELLGEVSSLRSPKGEYPVRKCGQVPIKRKHVTVDMASGKARWSGFAECSSIWACPVCSAKIRNGRAIETAQGTGKWIMNGNSAYMVTLTFPHDAGMDLKELLDMVSNTFRYVLADQKWRKVKQAHHIIGQIRALEITHGDNGFHPHLHVLVFQEGPMTGKELDDLDKYWDGTWRKMIAAQGVRMPSDEHGVKVEPVYSAEEAGLYIAKTQDGHSIGMELLRGDLKDGRKDSKTPFEMLAEYAITGDEKWLKLWHVYEQATKRKQAITWSKGLHQMLGVLARSDEEIVKEIPEGSECVAIIPANSVRDIVRMPGLRCSVLEAAEREGLEGINTLLALHGIAPALPPDEVSGYLNRWDTFHHESFEWEE